MVLYIDGNYPLHSLHGELVSSLANLGNEISVYVPMKGRDLEGKYNCSNNGVKVIYDDVLNNLDRVFFIQKIHKLVSEIEKKVDISKVDCILAGTLYSDGGAAYLLHKKYNIPFSVAVRETDVTYHMKWRKYLNSFAKKMVEEATSIIFLSPSYRKYIDKLGGNQSKYINIPNAVNDYWFMNSVDCRTLHSPVSLIFVGEISKRKNVSTIISVLSELKKSGIPATLEIVGSGKEEDRCKTLAGDLGISDMVHFNGWQTSKEKIKSFYDRADIFIMPSLRETFGTVYIEALSQGLPLIYTRNQGIDGYFPQGTIGYSCNPKDISEIKAAVLHIVENYQSISAKCISASGDFRWEVVASQYNQVIEKMRAE